jgi:hypothetical protein
MQLILGDKGQRLRDTQSAPSAHSEKMARQGAVSDVSARIHKHAAQINRKHGTIYSAASSKRQTSLLESISFMAAINPCYERGINGSLRDKHPLSSENVFQ